MDSKNLKRSLVAFIDILGFSQRVINIEKLSDLKKLDGDIDFVQEQFEVICKNESDKVYRKMAGKEILAFSDCIVISLSFDSEMTEDDGIFEHFLVELEQIAYAQMHCIQKGIFLRGGIDVGWWYHDGNKLLSNGLATAYQLEGKISVPVIALSNDLFKHFDSHPNKKIYENDFNPMELFKKYENSDLSFWFIDYLSICLKAQGWFTDKKQKEIYMASSVEVRKELEHKGWLSNVSFVFKQHASQIKKAYKRCEKPEVKGKYKWLAQYHNEVLLSYGKELSKFRIKL